MTNFPCGEISLRRNFLTAKYPTAKYPTAKYLTAKFPVTRIDRVQHKQCLQNDPPPPYFIPNMTKQAIVHTKPISSVDPGGNSYSHLKQLGSITIKAQTVILSLSIQQNSIPNIFKLGEIVPILKPTKSPTESSSYKPISLLSNHLKILERLILNHIRPAIPLSPTQHSFRAQHSTTTLLTTLTQHIHESLNVPKPAPRTFLDTTDISKAFHTVPKTLLLKKINRTNINTHYKK